MFKEIVAISKNYAIVKIDNMINDDLLNLNVVFEEDVKNALPEDILFSLREVLSLDPKPQYKTGGKVYKMTFGEYEISFLSDGGDITVTNAAKRGKYVPDTKGI